MARGKYQQPRRGGWILVLIGIVMTVGLVTLAIHWDLIPSLGIHPTETQPTTNSQPTTEPTTQPTTEPTTEPTTQPTTAPTEPFVESTASVGVTGDVLIHSPLYNAANRGNGVYDFSGMFRYITEYYQQYDFMIANLEVTLAGADRGYSSYPTFNCPDSIVDAVQAAGVDLLLNANNHTYDTGHSGFIRTQEVLNDKGMPHLGTRLTEEDPHYLVQDINGIQVGMVCYTYETGNTSDGRKTLNGIPVSHDDTNLISSFHPKKLDEFYENVSQTLNQMATEGADVSMLFIHWGDEYKLTPNAQQKEIAQQLCELGVDIIVGGHPHVIQPFDTLVSSSGHNTYCIYSVGNAISNQRRSNIDQSPNGHVEDSMIFGVTFEKWNDGHVEIAEIDILPVWVSREWKSNVGNVYYILPLDLDRRDTDWTTFDISSSEYLYGSYKRTMAIVGEGLNAYRESARLPERPMSAREE